jgi:hypothetical protein
LSILLETFTVCATFVNHRSSRVATEFFRSLLGRDWPVDYSCQSRRSEQNGLVGCHEGESSRDAEMTYDFRNRFIETQRSQWVCFMLSEPIKKK